MLSTAILVTSLVGYASAQAPPPTAVRVDAARMDTVQERRLVTGELRAVQRAHVATEEPGRIVEIPVEAGQKVRKGDLLARLDDKRLEIELSRLTAEDQAASAARDERQADLEWRERDLQTLQDLSKGGASNPKELYDAQSQVNIARAKVKTAEFAIAVIKGNLELMRKRVADMRIVAPFDGVIVIKLVEEGEWLSEGDAAVELVSTARVEAWLDVPQQFADAILGKQPTVAVNIEATGQSQDSANLRAVPNMDTKARTFPVVVRLDNSAGQLAPGMSVTAWVPTGEQAQQMTIHKDALMRGPTGAFVYVARGSGPDAPAQAMPMDVQMMFGLADRVVVKAPGLAAGDLLVVEGNERLFPTAPVIPLPRDAEPAPAEVRSGGPGPSTPAVNGQGG